MTIDLPASGPQDRCAAWLRDLEARHLADLTFPEVVRALRALSSAYVERRGRLERGEALAGAGKRAAFALFYGPLHYLFVQAIVGALPGAATFPGAQTLVDLGCGSGAAGAAWAGAAGRPPRLVGIDRHPWAVAEAARTYRAFGLAARVSRGDIAEARWPGSPVSMLAAFTLNELSEAAREAVLARAVARVANRTRDGRPGDRLLIVEPLAGFVAPWWNRWRAAVESAGGRGDEWRCAVDLPPIVAKLDKAAGFHHRELTGRSLWLA